MELWTRLAWRACNPGTIRRDHFGDVTKMVSIGSGAQRPVPDVELSRYACYLIVQNGDPSKPVIANVRHFATQARRQNWQTIQSSRSLTGDEKRGSLYATSWRPTTNIWRLRQGLG